MLSSLISRRVGGAPSNVRGFFVTSENFQMQANNWAAGTGASSAPLFSFSGRRLYNNARWNVIETPAKGTNVWTTVDGIIAALPAGCYLWPTFAHPAPWASARAGEAAAWGVGTAAEPTLNQDYADHITAYMTRYNPRRVEGWNEANLTIYYSGTFAKLITLTNLLYTTVKSGWPGTVVYCPCPTGTASNSDPSEGTFIQQMIDAGAQFDGISGHCYVNTALSVPDQIKQAIGHVMAIAAVADKYGKRGMVSEFGQQNWAALTELQKEQYFKRVLMVGLALGLDMCWYSYDVPTIGDITNPTRQQWWIDTYAALVNKFVRLKSIANDSTVTVTANGVDVTF